MRSVRWTMLAVMTLAACGSRSASKRPVVVVPEPAATAPRAVSNWCQVRSLPPLPSPNGERAVVRVPPENPSVKDEVARLGIPIAAEYGDALVVRARPEDLRALQARGITVQREPSGDLVVYRGVYFDTAPGTTSTKGAPPPPAWLMRVGPGDELPWIVQLVGPPTQSWVDSVSAAGGEILDSNVPNNAVVARLTPNQAEVVRRLPFVQWLNPIEPLHKLDPGLAGNACPVPASEAPVLANAARPRAVGQRLLVQIVLFGADPDAAKAVASEVETRKGVVRRELPSARTVVAELPPESLPKIAALPDVAAIERYTSSLGLTSGVRMHDEISPR